MAGPWEVFLSHRPPPLYVTQTFPRLLIPFDQINLSRQDTYNYRRTAEPPSRRHFMIDTQLAPPSRLLEKGPTRIPVYKTTSRPYFDLTLGFPFFPFRPPLWALLPSLGRLCPV